MLPKFAEKHTRRSKAKSASSQSHRSSINQLQPPTNIDAHRKPGPEDKLTSRSFADHDTTLLDVEERNGLVIPTRMVQESFVKTQELTTDVDRWKLDPIP